MTLKKKIRTYGNKTLSKYAKNPYLVKNTHKSQSFPLWAKISVSAVSMLIIGLVLGLTLSYTLTGNVKKYDVIYVDSIFETGEATETIKSWDEKSVIEKYPNFVCGNINYSVVNNPYGVPVDGKYADNKVGNVTGEGYDENNELHQVDGEAYKIKNVSSEAALLVKYSNYDNYYAYFNTDVSFETIQKIFDKLSPQESLLFTYSYYYQHDNGNNLHYIRFEDFDDKYIYETLLDQVDLVDLMKNENSMQTYTKFKQPFMFISYQSDRMGISNVPLGIGLNEDGYLIFTFAWHRYVYNIGIDKVNEYKNYVISNIKGFELVLKADESNL